jgi:hypothetical protein
MTKIQTRGKNTTTDQPNKIRKSEPQLKNKFKPAAQVPSLNLKVLETPTTKKESKTQRLDGILRRQLPVVSQRKTYQQIKTQNTQSQHLLVKPQKSTKAEKSKPLCLDPKPTKAAVKPAPHPPAAIQSAEPTPAGDLGQVTS